jgi:hypothetical protein
LAAHTRKFRDYLFGISMFFFLHLRVLKKARPEAGLNNINRPLPAFGSSGLGVGKGFFYFIYEAHGKKIAI